LVCKVFYIFTELTWISPIFEKAIKIGKIGNTDTQQLSFEVVDDVLKVQ